MPRLLILVKVRDKRTGHVYHRELQQLVYSMKIDPAEVLKAFDRYEDYETEEHILCAPHRKIP